MTPSRFLTRGPRSAFRYGWTRAISEKGTGPGAPGAPLEFGIVRLRARERYAQADHREAAWVLLQGGATVSFAGRQAAISRRNLFEDGPTAVHLSRNERIELVAHEHGAEFGVSYVPNGRAFEPRLFLPKDVTPEIRGAGLVQGACVREVRLIFDRKERPQSNLVLGEVINHPGRWSSYPPHHHAQPEIYHYRFTERAGYGHAEVGDLVYKVRDRDTIAIPPGLDHAQVSAPGYGMYYLWVIRHLPNRPYSGFTFAKEHRWSLEAKNQGWLPIGPVGGAT